jgi:lipopolysaccharide transport system ATP-binding protein
MRDLAIRVEGLSKQFRIGAPERYRTLRDTLTDTVTAPFRFLRNGGSANAPVETIWALKDISFDVKVGEVVGIIGRNGSGKSTLLKILSRITEPTEGHADIHGRVGSLLEVGTGFHPELTGRENIFLNGAILGMTKAEIQRKFDEIVAFSEVDKFIDTPVKHYSSGMYLRLAFAVAAHMEPEILIVDEVLAVGDQKFQEKCLAKMGEVGKQGRTVLFVSHSMPAIQNLCQRVVILEDGRIKRDAATAESMLEYLKSEAGASYSAKSSLSQPQIINAGVSVRDSHLLLSVEFVSPFPLSPVIGLVIYDPVGNPVFGTNMRSETSTNAMPASLSGRVEIEIPHENLRPNRYLLSLWLGDTYCDYCALERVLQFELNSGPAFDLPSHVVGSLYVPVTWRWTQPDAPDDSDPVGITHGRRELLG